MSDGPLVTWLLPVKNAMPHLPRALESIAAQTFKSWRVLAWDNGSTDGSREELERWIPAILPGQVVTDRPLPLGACLRTMVEEAGTELLARMDGDDVNHPARLALQVRRMVADEKLVALGANMRLIDPDGRPLNQTTDIQITDADLRCRLGFCNAMNHPTVLMRRRAALDAGNYRDVAPEDYDLWLRLASRGRLANLPQPLLNYRVWPSTFARLHGANRKLLDDRIVAERIGRFWPSVSPSRAMRLRRLLMEDGTATVELADISALLEAARGAALAAGQSRDYLTRTTLYQQQMRSLAIRWARRFEPLSWLASTVGKLRNAMRPQSAAPCDIHRPFNESTPRARRAA